MISKIKVPWRSFAPEKMPRKLQKVVISFCGANRILIKTDTWKKFSYPQQKSFWSLGRYRYEPTMIDSYCCFEEFKNLPWRKFDPENMPNAEMDILVYCPPGAEIEEKIEKDHWGDLERNPSAGRFETFNTVEEWISHYLPLSEISLPEGVDAG